MSHTASQCKGKESCVRCGGNHAFGKCGKNVPVKCCNCGGDHSVAFGGFQYKREVQKCKVINKVSYAEAVKRVNDEKVEKGSQP